MLPFVREWPAFRTVVAAVRHAAGLDRALRAHRPERLDLDGVTGELRPIVTETARHSGVACDEPTAAARAADHASPPRPQSAARRLRRRVLDGVSSLGMPSRLRRGSILVISYWPLIPVLDRMLADRRWRPAVPIEHRPTGPERSLRSAVRGGWLGAPSRRARRRAAGEVTRMLTPLREAGAGGDVMGLPIAQHLHELVTGVLTEGGPEDVARAKVLRWAFRRGTVSCVVGAADVDPLPRLIVTMAQEAGMHTFLLAHGAYLLPQPLVDLDVADEVALWSTAVAPPTKNTDRPIHVVGYPVPHAPPQPRRLPRPDAAPRIAVLGQGGHPYTSTIDARMHMRQWQAALGAISAAVPGATALLRPHPAYGLAQVEALRGRFDLIDQEQATTEPILDLLARCDLCVGGASAATLQAALVGTPVIVLNLTGLDWPWPIGGDTDVPVATSQAELEVLLQTWLREGVPGHDSLLAGLGAQGADATSAVLDLLEPYRASPSSSNTDR